MIGQQLRRLTARLLLTSITLTAAVTQSAWAFNIPVPNGDFETLYQPGSTTITATIDSYTLGTGPGVSVAPGHIAVYSDSTTGTTVDVPGWTGGGAVQASIGVSGSQGFAANGPGFGLFSGETTSSDAPLATIAPGLTYTLSAEISDLTAGGVPAGPLVLQLLSDGNIVTPDSSVSPSIGPIYQVFSNTYDAASLTGLLGTSLTIRIGTGDPTTGGPAFGNQLDFDNVQLTAVPEPGSLLLFCLGAVGLLLAARRRSG